jgi:hypothetical protein
VHHKRALFLNIKHLGTMEHIFHLVFREVDRTSFANWRITKVNSWYLQIPLNQAINTLYIENGLYVRVRLTVSVYIVIT